MDRRSFLKGAAAAAAVAPALPAIAAAPSTVPIVTGTVTLGQIQAGSIAAAKIDVANAFVIYERGMCHFGPTGAPRVVMGMWDDKPRADAMSAPDMGKAQVIIRRDEGAEIQNRFEVLDGR